MGNGAQSSYFERGIPLVNISFTISIYIEVVPVHRISRSERIGHTKATLVLVREFSPDNQEGSET